MTAGPIASATPSFLSFDAFYVASFFIQMQPKGTSALLLLMAILAKAFFALVRCHLVAFTFFSAWHIRSY